MSNFVIEGPEDFKKELEFGKFMDEILVQETKQKSIKQDDKEQFARKLFMRTYEKPHNNIRWGR